MEPLGPNLESVFAQCGRQFSLRTVLLLADRMLSLVQFVHSKQLLHRDLKPENFVVGQDASKVYLLDFGLAKKFIVDGGQHIAFRQKAQLTGTVRSSSR